MDIRPATVDDMDYLAAHMRAEDIAEVIASRGPEPISAIIGRAVSTTRDPRAAVLDGRLISLYGVCLAEDTGAGVNVGWLLSTYHIETCGGEWWATCKTELPRVVAESGPFVSAIHERHSKALVWAHSIGADILGTGPLGPEDESFVWVRFGGSLNV